MIGSRRKGELCASRSRIACGHALLLGATGSGKTILQVLLALRRDQAWIRCGLIDPKGDDSVLERSRMRRAARADRLTVLGPEGEDGLQPVQRGTDTEIADKMLAAEIFTEPHYQRLAQRYLGHVVRSLRSAGDDRQPRHCPSSTCTADGWPSLARKTA